MADEYGKLWAPTGVAHGSQGRWAPSKLGKLLVDKATKRGGGGQPQEYDSRGRFTSGGSHAVLDDMAGGHKPRPTITKLPKEWPQDADSTYEPVSWAADGAATWRRRQGLPAADAAALHTHRIDPKLSRAVADAYTDIDPTKPIGRAERAAWRELGDEVERQYDFMTKELGVKVDYVTDDPYPTVTALAADLRANKHIAVFDTKVQSQALGVKQYHPLFTDEQNNKFRAIHDVFGHASIGRGFDYDGEDAAFASHSTMFKLGSPAWRAMATETVGQNSYYAMHRDFDPHQRVGFIPDVLLRRRVRKSVVFEDPQIRQRAALRARYLAPVFELAKYDPQQPRDKRGRWSSEGGAAGIATTRIDTMGGFTVHPKTGDEPTEGYAVSKWPERSLIFKRAGIHPSRVARNIRRWLSDNRDMLSDPMVHIGGWFDRDSGNVYVDFSVVHLRGNRAEAIADAKAHNQKAIYSLHDQEEIDTGGTGEAMDKARDPKPDKFFIPTAGKTIDQLTDEIMEVLDLSVEEDDDDDEE